MSVKWIGIREGQKQIAKFLLSILLSFEFSDTLFSNDEKNNNKHFLALVNLELDTAILFVVCDTYRTKCWKMNFKIEKLIGGSLFNKPRNANRRQLRSVLTSKFKFDGAPFRDKTDTKNYNLLIHRREKQLQLATSKTLTSNFFQFLHDIFFK